MAGFAAKGAGQFWPVLGRSDEGTGCRGGVRSEVV
jgi:hypothetical protein